VAGAWIALLTDFGTRDSYAGVLRGVLATLAPHASLLDLTHDIPPGDIRAAALALWQATPYFPPQTVYLCVVDPGVGTGRRALAAAWPDRICVGPDNGLFSYLIDRDGPPQAVELARPEYQLPEPSATFHGRDIYAPAAAHLASGVPLSELGPPAGDLVRLEAPRLAAEDGRIEGEVLQADRFGNWITSIGVLRREPGGLRLEPWLGQGPTRRLPASSARVRLTSGEELELLRTYQDAPAGGGLAYIGSSGLLELAVNAGSAAALGIARGDTVELRLQA
jgi:hypothetical protein